MKTNWKYILVIFIAAALVGGWTVLLAAKQENVVGEYPGLENIKRERNEISSFLNNLKKETGIGFSSAEAAEFDWRIEGNEELVIYGKGFKAEEISNEQQQSIKSFFENQGFQIDIYNMASGTIVELAGYKNRETVCVVLGGVSGGEEGTGAEVPTYYTEVKCGKLK